jgi:hypothetical protein
MIIPCCGAEPVIRLVRLFVPNIVGEHGLHHESCPEADGARPHAVKCRPQKLGENANYFGRPAQRCQAAKPKTADFRHFP